MSFGEGITFDDELAMWSEGIDPGTPDEPAPDLEIESSFEVVDGVVTEIEPWSKR